MLPLRTVSSLIKYLLISPHLVHLLNFIATPHHYHTSAEAPFFPCTELKIALIKPIEGDSGLTIDTRYKDYVYAVYRLTLKMQKRIVMNLVGSQYSNWK
jgi:hypothetical protein